MSLDGWQKIIDANLTSVFYCMKYEIAALMKNNKGAIVNMSSILGRLDLPIQQDMWLLSTEWLVRQELQHLNFHQKLFASMLLALLLLILRYCQHL